MLADHGGELESVQPGHANVDQNNRNFVLEQVFERFPSRCGGGEVFAKLLKNDLIGKQLGRLIIDEKNVYLFMVHHRMHNQRWIHRLMARSSCSVWTGWAR